MQDKSAASTSLTSCVALSFVENIVLVYCNIIANAIQMQKHTHTLVKLCPPCEQVIKYGEPLDELQRDELRTAVEKLRRQMLRKSREYDCQILQERMELLHQAHQVPACKRSRCCEVNQPSLEENSSALNPSLQCW